MQDNMEQERIQNIFDDIVDLYAVMFGYRKQYHDISETLADKDIRELIEGAADEASNELQKMEGLSREETSLFLKKAFKKAEAYNLIIEQSIWGLLSHLKKTDTLIKTSLLCRKAGMLPIHLAWGIGHAIHIMCKSTSHGKLASKMADKEWIKKMIRERADIESEVQLVQLIADFYFEIELGNTDVIWKNRAETETLKKAFETGFMLERNVRGCAKCTLQALLDVTGEQNKMLVNATTGLAAGIGLCGDGICGGYSGGSIFFSHYLYQRFDEYQKQFDVGAKVYELTQALRDRYINTYGSFICKDIHRQIFNGREYILKDSGVVDDFEKAGAHQGDKCTSVVGAAAQWAMEILIANGLVKAEELGEKKYED